MSGSNFIESGSWDDGGVVDDGDDDDDNEDDDDSDDKVSPRKTFGWY